MSCCVLEGPSNGEWGVWSMISCGGVCFSFHHKTHLFPPPTYTHKLAHNFNRSRMGGDDKKAEKKRLEEEKKRIEEEKKAAKAAVR